MPCRIHAISHSYDSPMESCADTIRPLAEPIGTPQSHILLYSRNHLELPIRRRLPMKRWTKGIEEISLELSTHNPDAVISKRGQRIKRTRHRSNITAVPKWVQQVHETIGYLVGEGPTNRECDEFLHGAVRFIYPSST